MFHDLDEVLRQLLVREIPIRNGEVDVKFDQPSRKWSARLSRPTLNLFLHNIRENIKLRASQQWTVERNPDGTATQRRTPARVALHYMITAWANEPDDEHNLLARTLMALFRQPHLPTDLLPESLQDQPMPIPLEVAQEDTLRNPADVWNALDNEIRPAITLVITLSLDPYQPIITPLVRTRELRVGQSAGPSTEELVAEFGLDVFWTIGGTVRTEKQLEELHLTLVERGLDVPIQVEEDEGRFTIGKLRAGEYTLEVAADGRTLKRHKITVPAPDYELEV
ncbi:MAG: Pvc16 family protein [Anaerolineae bacterium]